MGLRAGNALKQVFISVKSFWGVLVTPSNNISDPYEREKARLLLSALTLVLPIGLIAAIVFPLLTGNRVLDPGEDARFILYTLGFWIPIFIIARSKNYKISAWIAILFGIAIILITALPDGDYADFFYLTFVLIFSSLFFNFKEVGIVYTICLLGIISAAIIHTDYGGSDILYTTAVITLGGLLSLVGTQYMRNIGALYYTQELLRDEQYRILLERTYDGLAEVKDNLILDADESFASMFSKRPEELVGIPITSILSNSQAIDLEKYTFETITTNSKGGDLHLEVLINPVHTSDTKSQLIAIRDISERKSTEKELRRQATIDPVTGLYNRTQVLKYVQQQKIEPGKSAKTSLLFLDLDDFKDVNDHFGHDTGDKLLKIVGERLQNAVRDGDIVARYGGDEFVVVCDYTPDDTDTIAQRILLTFHVPFQIGPATLHITTSIGMVRDISQYSDVDEILRAADEAMYRAKDKGKNQYAFAQTEEASL